MEDRVAYEDLSKEVLIEIILALEDEIKDLYAKDGSRDSS